jgi:hypothetical protein
LITAVRPRTFFAVTEFQFAKEVPHENLAGASLVAIFATMLAVTYAASSTPNAVPAPQAQLITCSSDNMRRNYCAADVRGGNW